MNKKLSLAAFLAGCAVVLWVAWGYRSGNPLALAMTLIVATVYGFGVLELRRFQRDTESLGGALAGLTTLPDTLEPWLAGLPSGLENAVRLRIEGERAGLPGPVLTPYLVGLLVMLGMLGTFLGMVLTFNGMVQALDGTADLQAIRASLTAPVKGLGLAFGTSVAGVATSAMLGLMSSLCRKERLAVAQLLERRLHGVLQPFSLQRQRRDAYVAIQTQAQALPAVTDALRALMERMESHHQAFQQQWLAEQERFHREAQGAYSALARSVDASLKQSLSESARVAGDTLRPAVEAAMVGIARETVALHGRVGETVDRQLSGLSGRFETAMAEVSAQWATALGQQGQHSEAVLRALREALAAFALTFAQRAEALMVEVRGAHASLAQEMAEQDRARLVAWAAALDGVSERQQQAWDASGAESLARQQALCHTLTETAQTLRDDTRAQASQTIAEVSRLMETAGEAPRAAAEVITQLRQALSDSMARDNTVLAERAHLMETLATLLDTIRHAAGEQRTAIDTLVAAAAAQLDGVSARLSETLGVEAGRLAEAVTQVGTSAVEVASLGEAMEAAVAQFAATNTTLVTQLAKIEGGLERATSRSDEQLAYYVAQARELIDLTLLSQKQIVDDLRRIPATVAEAA